LTHSMFILAVTPFSAFHHNLAPSDQFFPSETCPEVRSHTQE
jgi:hypothetical protein